jgi:alkylation response protein AidB-like acyl-CoA dehydrogenase
VSEASVRPRPLDLLYSETETELRAAVRGVLADKAAWPDVLARTESSQTYDTALWHTLAAEIGVAGLLIPEALGGAGASYRETAVVAEEIGRTVAPVPFLGSAVVATTAALSVGDAELLRQLASGAVTAALAVPFAAGPFAAGPSAAARFAARPSAAGSGRRSELGVRLDAPQPGDEQGSYRLTGVVRGVADALPADVLLVPADGVPFGLYVVQVGAGVAKDPVVSLDQTRQLCDIALDRALGRQVASGEAAERAVAAALLAGAGTLASEQLGVAERCLDMTLAYVKERKQFARPVGGFQAIKHRLADLWVLVTQARAAARAAANGLASRAAFAPAGAAQSGGEHAGTEAELMVALAKAACSDAALKAAQETIQLHGGIGFTWEHPAHLFLKRAKADSIGLGTADAHRAALAQLADLPAPG